jgi:hypothetical protein
LVQARKIHEQDRNEADLSQRSSRNSQRSSRNFQRSSRNFQRSSRNFQRSSREFPAQQQEITAQQQEFPEQQLACQPVTKDEYCINTVDRKLQNKQKECREGHQNLTI